VYISSAPTTAARVALVARPTTPSSSLFLDTQCTFLAAAAPATDPYSLRNGATQSHAEGCAVGGVLSSAARLSAALLLLRLVTPYNRHTHSSKQTDASLCPCASCVIRHASGMIALKPESAAAAAQCHAACTQGASGHTSSPTNSAPARSAAPRWRRCAARSAGVAAARAANTASAPAACAAAAASGCSGTSSHVSGGAGGERGCSAFSKHCAHTPERERCQRDKTQRAGNNTRAAHALARAPRTRRRW
jgi:hypothetical protein